MSGLLRTTTYVPVTQFYNGQSIFVTGGTGFLGKALVEKLLWSCPGIENIYLLIRPKKYEDVATRLSQLLNEPVFQRLKRTKPEGLNKVKPIEGDISQPKLGMSDSDEARLIRTVSIVFNSAASVNFNERLKSAVATNVLGTKHLLDLCHRMQKLKALLHVSTAYSNCDREEVHEVVYPSPYDPEKIAQLTEWMDDDLIDYITPKLISCRPNSYTFTKALAENVLLKENGNIPISIVRPSIVLSSLNEPESGWVDNWNGPTKLVAAIGKGLFHTMYGHGNLVADIVPVDIVANLMICAAWQTANKQNEGEITVFNCTSGKHNPISWKQCVSRCISEIRKKPLDDGPKFPIFFFFLSNPVISNLIGRIVHILPALAIDAFNLMKGKGAKMTQLQSRLVDGAKFIDYFTSHQWYFSDDNVRQLHSFLSEDDRRTFLFDVREIQWPAYLASYVGGIRHFLFKKNP